jgi:DNA polymerase
MTAADFLPKRRSLSALKKAAAGCEGCPLYARATQTVFGEGKGTARVMLVGEQPGDREDIEGKPFVGPAGRLLDDALEEAGIARDDAYVTNAVKHFKWEPRGKRRLHKKPSARELAACRPWLDAEIEAVGPRVVICLGATAAQSLLGKSFRITRQRGELFDSAWYAQLMATWHPSAVLRAPDAADRRRKREELVGDLKRAAAVLRT